MNNRLTSVDSQRSFSYVLSIPLIVYCGVLITLLAACFSSITKESFVVAFSQSAIIHSIQLSLFTSIASSVIVIALATPISYMLSKFEFLGKNIIDMLMDLPIFLPPLVSGLCILIFFNSQFGNFIETFVEIIYTWKGIMLTQVVIGCSYAIRVIKSSFDSTSSEMEKLSMVLGASRWKTFLYVSIPVNRNGIISGGIISWCRIFGLYGPILLVAGTMRNKTELMPSSIFLETSIGKIDVALVIAFMMIIISLIILFIFKRIGGGAQTV
jgi:molybdate transport system permease protein